MTNNLVDRDVECMSLAHDLQREVNREVNRGLNREVNREVNRGVNREVNQPLLCCSTEYLTSIISSYKVNNT